METQLPKTMAEANRSGGGTQPWKHLWRRLWSSPWPTLGCEISQTGISVARWSWNTARLEAVAWKPLPDGAIEASPLRENIRQPEPVREALGAALALLGIVPSPNSSRHPADSLLVIPDQAARLFVFELEILPQRPAEALSLIQWRLKKSVPFDIESAAISYLAQRRGEQWEVLAVTAPQAVVRQYETMLEDFGLRPRCVILSTLASLGWLRKTGGNGGGPSLPVSREGAAVGSGPFPAPAALKLSAGSRAGAGPGVLVGKYSPPWFTTAILQAGQLRLFRTVGLSAGPEGLLSPDHVLEALYPSMAYFQDNFGGQLERAYLCGLGDSSPALAELLQREFRLEVAPLGENGSLGGAGLEASQQERYFSALMGVVWEHSRG